MPVAVLGVMLAVKVTACPNTDGLSGSDQCQGSIGLVNLLGNCIAHAAIVSRITNIYCGNIMRSDRQVAQGEKAETPDNGADPIREQSS